jgi:hypothetical protein
VTWSYESYSLSGVLADATWFADDGEGQEPAVGEPRVISVNGADATMVHRVPGSRPERIAQPAVLAMGLMMPGAEAGDEPVPAELWCISDDFTFSVAGDLSSAALEIPTCEAEVFTYDEGSGEEVATGETFTLGVSSTWTATGPLESVRSISHYLFDGSFTVDRTRAAMRPASADLTVTGLPGGTLELTAQEAAIQDIKAATLLRQ